MRYICLIVIFATLLKCYQSDESTDVSTLDVEPEDDNNLQQVGAEYLQNVMHKLEKDRLEGQPIDIMELPHMFNTERASDSFPEKGKDNTLPPSIITGPTPVPSTVEAQVYSADPPPALTTDELNAIYEAAITKGSTLSGLQGSGTKPISNFIHPPPPPPPSSSHGEIVKPAAQGPADGLPGYYYYFYPIKSFTKTPDPKPSSPPPPPHPTQMHVTMMESPNKGMEPLFMAISGFIGMALMFVFSVLFLPKFGKFKDIAEEEDLSKLKEAPDELGAFLKVFVETMDGKDCSERLACEVGRILRNMKMGNKPLRVLEIVLPPKYAKQITQVRKAHGKKEKCNFIPCKFNSPRPPAKTNDKNKKPWKNSQKAHELWMKNFQKGKISFKQPENIWNNLSDNR